MKNLTVTATVAALVTLAGAAAAQQPPASPTDVPALAPSAGAIIVPPSMTSANPAPTVWTAQRAAEAFLRADTNRDGLLSRAEANTLGPARQSFEDMDANKDGSLSRAELEAGVL